MNRVFTADGPGVITATDSRQGVTWLCIEGAAFSGWYPGHEVTADIGDGSVTTPDDFPPPDKGAKLPYDPRPRDKFKDELTIQPIHDLPENLDPTNSIDSIRNYEPNAVFGSTHPFAKERFARHSVNDEAELDFDHVPGDWKDDNPGLSDYGPEYDEKNPQVVNPADGWVRDGGGRFHHPLKNAEFTENGLPEGWNSKGTPEELDNPFNRGGEDDIDASGRGGWNDHGEPEEYGDLDHAFEDDDEHDSSTIPFGERERLGVYREAGSGNALEHLWWGQDQDWTRTADVNLNDSGEQNMTLDDMINPQPQAPVQQVPWDPSHTVAPDGDMQVLAPDQQNNDDDLAGHIQNALGGGQDELQGVQVPHQPDADDELAGMPVPHVPGGGPVMGPDQGGLDPEQAVIQNLTEHSGPTGNQPVGLYTDDALAHMAANFLTRTAGKDYSEGEQNLLMHETGQAAQLGSLNLTGSIYEDDEEGSFLAL